MSRRILVVDDDREICRSIEMLLRRNGFSVEAANDGNLALRLILRQIPDVMILDYRMEGLDGFGLMERLHDLGIALPTIMITAYPGIHEAVRAIKLGATEYLAKPFDHDELLHALNSPPPSSLKYQSKQTLSKDRLNHSGSSSLLQLGETMGPSGVVQQLIIALSRVAKTNLSVLIVGETGSGKELVARAIHQASPRAEYPFVALDCGAVAESLIENEMFGHEKGAFTGATEQKIGKLEAASGGTLFLDEIANLPLGAQTKLLRALEERAIYRLGGTKAIPLDFRLLGACNVNLELLVNEGKFRADLFYRLGGFVVELPPLRERKEDIPHLAMRFLAQANSDLGKNIKGFSAEAMTTLEAHRWPGNVRELLHVVHAAALMADGDVTEASALKLTAITEKPRVAIQVRAGWKSASLHEIVRLHLTAVEREAILEALNTAGGNKAKAARMLKIDYKTIHQRLKSYGVNPKNKGGSCDG